MDITVVVNAEIELLTAVKSADVRVLERLLHDNLLFNLPDGNTITKELDLESYKSGKMKIDFLEAADQSIAIIDDTAVVAVTISLKGNFDANPISGVFRYIRVWKKFEGQLKVIAGSCVPLN
ncbi:nuclear transport factor 2 family protein [Flavobacterium procerum]|uniref:Nuclear transport factor 2 family protein n=1 Tax=Flavobacterium procerum TaxID=1455569 RepID=A0ABV6BJP8_9FLAO